VLVFKGVKTSEVEKTSEVGQVPSGFIPTGGFRGRRRIRDSSCGHQDARHLSQVSHKSLVAYKMFAHWPIKKKQYHFSGLAQKYQGQVGLVGHCNKSHVANRMSNSPIVAQSQIPISA
jgi:hypothetical protein